MPLACKELIWKVGYNCNFFVVLAIHCIQAKIRSDAAAEFSSSIDHLFYGSYMADSVTLHVKTARSYQCLHIEVVVNVSHTYC